MIIEDVRPFVLRGDESYADVSAGGEALDQGDWLLLVRVSTDDGSVAWADVETLGPVAARAIAGPSMGSLGFRTLSELLVGRAVDDLDQITDLWHQLFIGSVYYGRRGAAMQALSAIDNCLWSLLAQHRQTGIAELLGGRRRRTVPGYASTLFRATPEANARAAAAYRDRGFAGVKFGWGGFGLDPARDRANLDAVVEVLGPSVALMLDPGWYVEDHGRPRVRTDAETVAMLDLVCDYETVWVEDIVHPEKIEDYRRWATDYPDLSFAAGEQLATTWELLRLLDLDSISFLQPDLSRCGGLTVARQLVDRCAERGVQLVTHSWLTDLLHGYSLQLLASLDQAPWVEFNVAQSALSRGVCVRHLQLSDDGTVAVPEQISDVDDEFVTAHEETL